MNGQRLEAGVVVVGGGMAGLCAAVSALEAGASVLLLDKGTRFGGSMRLSGGLIWTFERKAQLREEIPDGNAALQDMVIEGLEDGLAWLREQGVALSDARRFQWYGRGRGANPPQMTDALLQRLEALGGRALPRTGMATLCLEGGRVSGVRAFGPEGPVDVAAGAVILATGGFQGNAELLARYVTPNAAHMYLRGNPWSTGDAFIAATEAGAAVTPWLDAFYGHALAAPPARFGPYEFLDVTQRYGPAAVALNLEGRRFADESTGTGEEALNLAVAAQTRASAVYIVDDVVAEGVPGFAPPRVAIERARLCGGPVLQADSLKELCEGLAAWGLPPQQALATLREFNAALSDAGDGLRPPRLKYRYPVASAPFTAVAVRAGITFTCGGLQVDTDMSVLRRSSTTSTLPLVTADVSDVLYEPVAGLYAAGCDAGGISTSGYMGGLATALVTGRVAGEKAAASGGRGE